MVLLQFRLAVRGEWKISMAFGMEPATFLGLIEVMLEMGIMRWHGVSSNRLVSIFRGMIWFSVTSLVGLLTLVTIPTILARK